MRVFICFLCLFFVACDYLPFAKKSNKIPLDTLVNFSTVDAPPTFEKCNTEIEKKDKEQCFQRALLDFIALELKKQEYKKQLVVKNSINEQAVLTIAVSKSGVFKLKEVQLNEVLAEELPDINIILTQAVARLPKAYPALKRGIPVATEYFLPLQITLKN